MSSLKISVPVLWDNDGNFRGNTMHSISIEAQVVNVVARPIEVFPPNAIPVFTDTLQINTEEYGVLYLSLTLSQYQGLIRTAESGGSTPGGGIAIGDPVDGSSGGGLLYANDVGALAQSNIKVSVDGNDLIIGGTTLSGSTGDFNVQMPEKAGTVAMISDLHQLAPTAVKTTTYTAAVSDFVPCDNTGASFTVTLPTAPVDKSVIGVKLVILGAAHTITIAAGGSDVFNKTGGSTSLSLSLLNQAVILQYKASGGIWYVISTDAPVTAIGVNIGAAVTGGAANRVLFEGSSNLVAENANLTYDAFTLGVTGAITLIGAQANTINALNNTTVPALTLQNTTPAASSGVARRQYSPSLRMMGTNWNGSASVTMGFRQYVSGGSITAVNPIWNLDYTLDGTTFTNIVQASWSTVPGFFIIANTTINGTLAVNGGNLSVGNGNLVIGATGNTVTMTTSTAASALAGTATLVAGTVTISTTAILATDIIMLSVNTPGGTSGLHYAAPSASIIAGTSFIINSVSAAGAVVVTDTSTINWWVMHTQ